MDIPRARWAKAADGTELAYQVFGDGPVDVLYIPGWVSHLEVYWEYPAAARFFRRLGSIARVIMFDKRGAGMSDRVTSSPDLETMMDDVRAVLDAAGSERTVLWGDGADGGGSCAVFAATFPERVLAFIWWSAAARIVPAPDYPWGFTEEEAEATARTIREAWGDPNRGDELLEMVGCPSIADDPEAQRWIAKFYRYSTTPGGAAAFDHMWEATDTRSILPTIHVPTVAVRRDDPRYPPEELDHIVSRIPGAIGVSVPGIDFSPLFGDLDPTFAMVERFLGSVREEEAELDRVLATVLFTDIVDSTSSAAVMGDRKWRATMDEHDRIAKGLIGRYRGTYRKSTGDGLMATFDGPARAVRCAQAFVEAVKPLGVEIRAGAHTGEVTFGENDLAGIGVHVAARVAAMAGTSEVWASSTVKDLTAGSGLTFQDAGEHELKGVPDRWRLYRVVPS